MANKSLAYQESMFASMILELNSKNAQQAQMQQKLQQELQNVKYKLEQASLILAQKDLIIGSLENDLEHMIDQLLKIQHNRTNTSQQWISRAVPGLNPDGSAQALA